MSAITLYLKNGEAIFNRKGVKRLKQYNRNGEIVGEFFDKKEATEKTGIKSFHVGRGLDGGYLFSYGKFDTNLFIKFELSRKVRMKKVLQIDKEGNIVAEFEGVREAGRITGIDHRSIAEIANGSNKKRHTAGNFKWKYK